MTKQKERLQLWQEKLAQFEAAWEPERAQMDEREAIYRGRSRIDALVDGDVVRRTPHVRNIAAELIEAQVDANLPQPKVTARRREDEALAVMIEDMLRNKLERLPMEVLNDQMERTVPIQGGGLFLLEWDSRRRDGGEQGQSVVSVLHPKQLLPQPGVTGNLEDMDEFILKLPQTKEFIRRHYGLELGDESESEPQLRGLGDEGESECLVTQYVAYYRNEQGGIGRFSWVNDTVLEDSEDYQQRRSLCCADCGHREPLPTARCAEDGEEEAAAWRCPECGGAMEERSEEMQELWRPVKRTDGTEIPGVDPVSGEPTRIPWYRPNIYPVFLQKSVSVYGRLLGESDIDKVRDQQNTINRLEKSIIDQLLAAGSYITLPPDPSIRVDTGVAKVIRLKNVTDKNYIGVYDLKCDVEQTLSYLEYIYQEARDIIGITDSFQGRRDASAQSAVAKKFAASQAAGRMQSKRVMKKACWAALFEAMFKFELAYADEPRPVLGKDERGERRSETWNKWDFLCRDEAGEWYWNDRFLFSCDSAAALAGDRTAMWEELQSYFSAGAFGDPTSAEARILFWTKMAELHYPGAAQTRENLAAAQAREQAAAAAIPSAPTGAAMTPTMPTDTAMTDGEVRL